MGGKKKYIDIFGSFTEPFSSNATWFGKWWLYCTQTGSRGQRKMETQRKDVKNLLYFYSRRLLMTAYKYAYSQNKPFDSGADLYCSPYPGKL